MPPGQRDGPRQQVISDSPPRRQAARAAKRGFDGWYAWASQYAQSAGVVLTPGACRPDFGRGVLRQNGRIVLECDDPVQLAAGAMLFTAGEWMGRLREQFVVFHAAALGHDEGALLIVGESGAGKTTLAEALVHRGFAYFGDEFAAVCPAHMEVAPLPVTMFVKSCARARAMSPALAAEVLECPPRFTLPGGPTFCCVPRREIVPNPGRRFPVRWIVLLTGGRKWGGLGTCPGAGGLATRPTPADPGPGEIARRLCLGAQCFNAASFAAATALARRAVCRIMDRADLTEMADAVVALVGGPPAELQTGAFA